MNKGLPSNDCQNKVTNSPARRVPVLRLTDSKESENKGRLAKHDNLISYPLSGGEEAGWRVLVFQYNLLDCFAKIYLFICPTSEHTTVICRILQPTLDLSREHNNPSNRY